MKATEKYFPVVLFIMLCKAILTFESVDEILKCGRLPLPETVATERHITIVQFVPQNRPK